ncbi:hypothetical protein [Abyssibius alkaniclasticus]|uniref:hypothetical protein n=1 Tax=Abyssibius alkaniclasticus TaxID=2881234 RepID=UPI00405904EB
MKKRHKISESATYGTSQDWRNKSFAALQRKQDIAATRLRGAATQQLRIVPNLRGRSTMIKNQGGIGAVGRYRKAKGRARLTTKPPGRFKPTVQMLAQS